MVGKVVTIDKENQILAVHINEATSSVLLFIEQYKAQNKVNGNRLMHFHQMLSLTKKTGSWPYIETLVLIWSLKLNNVVPGK